LQPQQCTHLGHGSKTEHSREKGLAIATLREL